jgi:hypothetical protein
LAIGQVPDEIAELVSAVDEIGIVDNFAKNEGIFLGHHITLISVTLNGVIGKPARIRMATPSGVTPNGVTEHHDGIDD